MSSNSKEVIAHIELLDLTIIPSQFEVHRKGTRIPLPKLSFELLMYFIQSKNEVCSLDEISQGVWGDVVVSNETLIQRIRLLRKALDDPSKSPRFIESIRGRGYRLLPKVNVVLAKSTSDTKEVEQNVSTKKNRRKSRVFSPILAIAVIVLFFALFLWWVNHDNQEHDSIAKQAYRIEDNNRVKDSNTNANTALTEALIARAQHYLSVNQASNTQRAIELFEQATTDIPNNLNAKVGLSLALSKSVCRYNQDIANAYRARLVAEQAFSVASDALQKSQAQKAIAYAWDCLGNIENALAHYIKSIEYNPNNSQSISSAAYLFEVKGDLLSAYEYGEKALLLSPNNFLAKLQQTRIYELLHYKTQAYERYKRLFILYPDNVFTNESYLRFLYHQGNLSLARNTLDTVLLRDIERQNVFIIQAEVSWLLEGEQAAIKWYEEASTLTLRRSFAGTMVKILNKTLTKPEARALIETAETRVSEGHAWPHQYIESAVLSSLVIDDHLRAIDFLEQAVALGFLDSEYLNISPLFSQLRDYPAFYQVIDIISQKRTSMATTFNQKHPDPEFNL